MKFRNLARSKFSASVTSERAFKVLLQDNLPELTFEQYFGAAIENLREALQNPHTRMLFARDPQAAQAPMLNVLKKWEDDIRAIRTEVKKQVLQMAADCVKEQLALIDQQAKAWVTVAAGKRPETVVETSGGPTE